MWVIVAEAFAQEDPPSAEVPQPPALERSVIDRTIRRRIGRIRSCYRAELVHDPLLAGELVVSFTIGRDGTVTTTETRRSTLGAPEVERCILDRFAELVFPAPAGGGIVRVSYPFVFTPMDGRPLPADVGLRALSCAQVPLGDDLSGWVRRPDDASPLVAVRSERGSAAQVALLLPRLSDPTLEACLVTALESLPLPRGWSYWELPAPR